MFQNCTLIFKPLMIILHLLSPIRVNLTLPFKVYVELY